MTMPPGGDRDAALRRMLVSTATTGSLPRPRSAPRRTAGVLAAGVLVGALAGGGLAATALNAPGDPLVAQSATAEPIPTFTAQSASGGDGSAGYEPRSDSPDVPELSAVSGFAVVATPAQLANRVSIVLRGSVAGLEASTPEGGRLVLTLSGVTVAKGEVDRQAGGAVRLLLPIGVEDGLEAGDFGDRFPIGLDVVAYVAPSVATDLDAEGPVAGYEVTTPQSLVVQRPGSDLVEWPMLGERRPGLLADALPDGTLIGGVGQ